MVEQNSKDLNQIRDQIQDTENQNDINQKISELDNGKDKSWQVEYDSIQNESHILTQHSEEVMSVHVATENRIIGMVAEN